MGGSKLTLASGYPTKTAAGRARTLLAAEKLRGDALVPRGGKVTLAEFVAMWQPSWETGLKASTRRSEPARLRNHILPLLGDYPLGELEPAVVRAWVALLLSGDEEMDRWPLSAKSVRNAHGLLHAILRSAVHDKLLRANPCERTGLPKVVHKEQRFLTEAELARLVGALPDWARPITITLAATGLRWAEACGLKCKYVDVLAGTLRVEETAHELSAGQPLVVTPPKTSRSRRTVTYPRSVAEVLAGRVAGRQREAWVFTGPDGGPVRYRKFWRLWVATTARAGLTGVRIHDLRHTAAAHLIAGNVPLTAIQRRLGHSSISVTSDLYGHLLPEIGDDINAAIEASLSLIDFGADDDRVRGRIRGRGVPPDATGCDAVTHHAWSERVPSP